MIEDSREFREFLEEGQDPHLVGSEHVVEFVAEESRFAKVTIPPAFGLSPFINRIPELSADPSMRVKTRGELEFRNATTLDSRHLGIG